MQYTDQQLSTFARAEGMGIGQAFEAQHAVSRPNRKQRQMPSIDGTEIVSVWTDRLDLEEGKGRAHVNTNALSRFSIGQRVRVVLVAPHDTKQGDGARVRLAWADHAHEWTIREIDGDFLDLEASGMQSAEALFHEAKSLVARLSAVLSQMEKSQSDLGG